jgi:hypothetical protein
MVFNFTRVLDCWPFTVVKKFKIFVVNPMSKITVQEESRGKPSHSQPLDEEDNFSSR